MENCSILLQSTEAAIPTPAVLGMRVHTKHCFLHNSSLAANNHLASVPPQTLVSAAHGGVFPLSAAASGVGLTNISRISRTMTSWRRQWDTSEWLIKDNTSGWRNSKRP